ncbi:2-amino-4-hydroxy-6-hydroxymethyldihydropteridine diphosphokinase [Amphiplicatus metriothermophilus]|uniref:2-amino-4-hydroxy-6-hydroxymethyldihydropteridine pyrophosphokinase n=1 Tax=Amphiplicatus metriothermophilus TaxID=1519374 RepID=A0A239PPK7_9PROT|nr:2-amino-4-hydroxy-6-hydroxymethyldihydropteridine diphosphokinase [Amphiplicatus metriothermophilus]MBB5518777.1 2-amino-4-hydroxy-6-hydroxymethyldihydropteridine diphosphokinase [Amphiplicatus metriothermophilus]SNT72068.1 2-amino-4-hydroxy-6-hydroxymethyldihydropteridinediphosphokinase [Amphiplicatus metriothermophilus]
MILVALGSNSPFGRLAPADIILSALGALGRVANVRAASRLYASPAWPDPTEPPFVNAVARLETALCAEALLASLHAVEAGFGRRRSRPNAPRTLDLDLLDYHGMTRVADAASSLVLPHPRLAKRAFVLAPLAEVAPAWRHPATGETVAALAAVARNPAVRPLAAPGSGRRGDGFEG